MYEGGGDVCQMEISYKRLRATHFSMVMARDDGTVSRERGQHEVSARSRYQCTSVRPRRWGVYYITRTTCLLRSTRTLKSRGRESFVKRHVVCMFVRAFTCRRCMCRALCRASFSAYYPRKANFRQIASLNCCIFRISTID